MTRQQDTVVARQAADDWAAEHSLLPSGGYSGRWYIDAYLNGWWPDWVEWMAVYDGNPGSQIGGQTVAHQWTSTPVDQNVMLESEIVTGPTEPAQPTEPTAAEFRQAFSYIDVDVLAPLRAYKLAKVKKALAEIDRVAAQYGAI